MDTMPLPPLPDEPLVSVLVLTHDHEAFVADAIESVLAQDVSADRMEFVILDDGSTDGTAAAIAPYRDHARVTRVISRPNRGLRASMNEAMSLMTGDVFTFVSGDDIWLPGRVETLLDALRACPDAGLVYSDCELCDVAGRPVADSFVAHARVDVREGRVRGALLAGNFISGGASMLRGCLKDVYHPIPAVSPWEDYWWAWAVSGAAEVTYTPQQTFRYRRHDANMSLGASGEKFAGIIAQELPFRRHMLAEVRADEATAIELVLGVAALINTLEHASPATLAGLAGGHAGPLLAEMSSALAAGRPDDAALLCARAAALNPVDPALGEFVHDIALELGGTSSHVAAERSVASQLGARAFLVLADGEQLLAAPALLRAYADRFRAGDDATLVIHASAESAAKVTAELPALLSALGMALEDDPDMVATSESPARLRTLVGEADAIVGPDVFEGGLPAFGADDLGSLRVLAEHRWRYSAPAR
jgi:glycosyltransferase involved in cell wall biosynthesis